MHRSLTFLLTMLSQCVSVSLDALERIKRSRQVSNCRQTESDLFTFVRLAINNSVNGSRKIRWRYEKVTERARECVIGHAVASKRLGCRVACTCMRREDVFARVIPRSTRPTQGQERRYIMFRDIKRDAFHRSHPLVPAMNASTTPVSCLTSSR